MFRLTEQTRSRRKVLRIQTWRWRYSDGIKVTSSSAASSGSTGLGFASLIFRSIFRSAPREKRLVLEEVCELEAMTIILSRDLCYVRATRLIVSGVGAGWRAAIDGIAITYCDQLPL